MALTSIGSQKTPGRPTEVTFAANTGLPNPDRTINLIGHMGPTGGAAVSGVASGSATPYTVVAINNAADPTAGGTEAAAKFGTGSELAKMVVAAINANALAGNSTFPSIICTPLAQSDTNFGANDAGGTPAALAAASRVPARLLVSPYDGNTDLTNNNKLAAIATLMSGATRVQNAQYGSSGCVFNRSVTDPSTLNKYDTQFMTANWLRDTGTGGNLASKSIGEMAAAYAAILAGNGVPFNPVDGAIEGGVDAPALSADWITVGAGLESESALNRGWSPSRVLPNGSVAIVRSVTTRLTVGADGVTAVTAYYDFQDFDVLYFFRQAVVTRFNQPDFARVKASLDNAKLARAEVIRMASAFEDQGMFQNVAELSKLIVVERNASDRSRFDVFVPVNVVPGLHVIATNIQATTEGDVFTV